MTTEFSPKITYRMAAMHLPTSKPTSPWQYLDNWSQSDRGPDETLAKLNERMQNRWPGKYRIVEKEVRCKEHMYKILKWDFEFETPAEETMFRIKYS